MLGRRFIVLVLVLMGLTALAASVAPRQPVPRERASETATPGASGSPTVTTVARELQIGEESETLTVDVGAVVELTVSGDERDSVVLMGRIDTMDPVSPARFSVFAQEAGEHPIELLEDGREIGRLVIRD